jgi:hypothetical protein
MNKRIKQLAEQAGATVLTTHGMEHVVDGCYVIGPARLEKFAELIVQECVGVLSLTEDGVMKMNLNGAMLKLVEGIGKAYSTGIKQHFGVEE